MPIETLHDVYTQSVKWWQTARDAVEGEAAIKRNREVYLPWPNKPANPNEDERARYKAYLERAEYENTPEMTRQARVGILFNKEVSVEIPANLEQVKLDANGAKFSLNEIAKICCSEVDTVSHVGILTEYSLQMSDDTELSKAQRQELGGRPLIKVYPAESIINWDYSEGTNLFRMIILKQVRKVYESDDYTAEYRTDYLELRLDEEGYYFQKMHRDTGGGFDIEAPVYPTAGGQKLTFIPFEVATDDVNNEITANTSSLYPIARKAISKYQVNADFKDHMFRLKGTPWISGLDQGFLESLKEMNGGTMPAFVLGGSDAWTLPAGASTGMISASEGVDHYFRYFETNKADQLDLGARFSNNEILNESATGAMIRSVSENASLTNVANNVSLALTRTLKYCAMFEGVSEEGISYAINSDFSVAMLNSQEALAARDMFQAGLATKDMTIQKLIDGGFYKTTLTVEQIVEAINNADPTQQALAQFLGSGEE